MDNCQCFSSKPKWMERECQSLMCLMARRDIDRDTADNTLQCDDFAKLRLHFRILSQNCDCIFSLISSPETQYVILIRKIWSANWGHCKQKLTINTNQVKCKLNPHMTPSLGNRTRATLMGGECSHHCAIPKRKGWEIMEYMYNKGAAPFTSSS